MTDKYGTLFYVANENTLIYKQSHWTSEILPYVSCGVLAGSVLRGGHDPKDGCFPFDLSSEKIRPATLADFDFFRVMPPPLG